MFLEPIIKQFHKSKRAVYHRCGDIFRPNTCLWVANDIAFIQQFNKQEDNYELLTF